METTHNSPGAGSSNQPSREASVTLPYERVVRDAVAKLRNETPVFLLAYLALVVGFAAVSPSMTTELRTLLYVLPLLAFAMYIYQRSRGLRRDSTTKITTLIAGEDATTIGRRGGTGANTSGRVEIFTGIGGKRATTIGIDAPATAPQEDTAEEAHLLQIFRRLGRDGRGRLLRRALDLDSGGKAS